MTQGNIFVPLAREPYEKFHRGEKTIEVRNRNSPVARQVLKAITGTRVTLSLGYGTKRRMEGFLGVVFERDNWASCGREIKGPAAVGEVSSFFRPDEPIVAFQVLEAVPIV